MGDEAFAEQFQRQRTVGEDSFDCTPCNRKNCKCGIISIELEDPPSDAVAIKAYGNTNFVNIMAKKPLYEQLEKKAKNRGQQRTSSYITQYSYF